VIKPLDQHAVVGEEVDEAEAVAGHVVLGVVVLAREAHQQPVAEGLDAERRIALGRFGSPKPPATNTGLNPASNTSTRELWKSVAYRRMPPPGPACSARPL
jgi:hypothetical protein